MKTIRIPGVEFPVSQFCLGSAYFGSRESEELSFELMDYYYSLGGRFINTAHEYGNGKSETTIGKWARMRGVRHEIVVTSKCGEDHNLPKSCAMHHGQLLEDIDETLSRTGFDYVDFYLLHLDDETVPVAEIVESMAEIQKAGKIRHYGCSNWSIARQIEADTYALAHGLEPFRIDEIEMNLTQRNVSNANSNIKWLDADYIAYHNTSGRAVGAYSPLAVGVLTKLLRNGDTRDWSPYQIGKYDTPHNREIARRLKRLSEETGYTPTQLQLAWILNQPYAFTCFPIVGASKLYQLEDSIKAVDIRLTPDMLRMLHGDDLLYIV